MMNTTSCPCKRTNCERHGDCAACRNYHHNNQKKPLTRCEKLEVKEQKHAEKQQKRENRQRKRER